MNNEQIDHSLQLADLISGYIRNELTETELKQLREWIEARAENRTVFEKICNERNLEKTHQRFKAYSADLASHKVKTELGILVPQQSRLRLWPRYAGIAAAVAAIVISIGIYFFKAPRHPELVSESKYANDIPPGKNTATLIVNDQGKMITLSDAKTGVVISDGKLAYSDGTLIQNSSGALSSDVNETMTLKTPRGGTYQITLSDGTRVWLNAASSLTYSANLKARGGLRKVKLSGEAYFEVIKDKQHPFVVESKGQSVTVLGTHFNINAYDDEGNIKTTLLEGSVKVNEVVIKPNQQATVTGTSGVTVNDVESSDFVDWKNGVFIFKGESIESIMRKVSRWYNVEVIYEPGVRKDLLFGGYVSRTLNISSVLRIMERTGKVKFKIADNRVYVKN